MKNLSIMLTDAMYKKVIDHKLDSSVPVQIVESIRHGKEIRWIPVSERLPEELTGVLVYCPTNDNIFCAYLEKGVWKVFSPKALEEIKEIVIAWMPLPKPYSEVSE